MGFLKVTRMADQMVKEKVGRKEHAKVDPLACVLRVGDLDQNIISTEIQSMNFQCYQLNCSFFLRSGSENFAWLRCLRMQTQNFVSPLI